MRRGFLSVLVLIFATSCGAPKAEQERMLPTPRVLLVPFETATPSAVPTRTPSPDELIFPFTIDGLVMHDFRGGNISLLQELDGTDDYKRYRIAYPSDGLTITGVLQIPRKGEAPFPVVIMNHGYFNRADFSPGDGTARAAEFLNRRGYLTIASDYRSWGDSDLGPSLFYSGLVIDVVNLIHAVHSIPQADPERIGIWGHSMGGGVTLKVLMLDTPVRAAVLYSTVSADYGDLIERWGPGCIGDIATGERYYGCNSSDILPVDMSPALQDAYFLAVSDSEMLKQVSPIDHLDRIRVPIQIHYGTEDGKTTAGTPPEWSRKLQEALLEAGVQSELFAYEGQGHSFLADSWYAFMERTARFFDQNLKTSS